jgi:hypothetical protein
LGEGEVLTKGIARTERLALSPVDLPSPAGAPTAVGRIPTAVGVAG